MGYDFSPVAIKWAKKRVTDGRFEFRCADLRTEPSPASFSNMSTKEDLVRETKIV